MGIASYNVSFTTRGGSVTLSKYLMDPLLPRATDVFSQRTRCFCPSRPVRPAAGPQWRKPRGADPHRGRAMKCVICKHGELVPGTTVVTRKAGTTTLVLKDVPALVCESCGEEYFESAT